MANEFFFKTLLGQTWQVNQIEPKVLKRLNRRTLAKFFFVIKENLLDLFI